MRKTLKIHTTNNSKTKKQRKQKNQKNQQKNLELCPISLKSFETSFSKRLNLSEIKKKRNLETFKKMTFAKELLNKFAPSAITPNNNFYDYINYTWLKNISLEKQQKYIVQVDDFRLSQDKVYKELNTIIVDYFNNNNNTLSKNLKSYYNSVIKTNNLSYSKQLALENISIIDNFIKNDNPWELLAYFNSNEMVSIHAPFVWSLNPDDKQPDIFRCYIDPMTFILLDINVYYNDGTDIIYKDNYRKQYFNHVHDIFVSLIGKNDFNSQDVFDVQVDMLDAFDCNFTKTEKEYNKVTSSESFDKYGFNWKEFSKYLGFNKSPDFFITSNLNYLKCGSKIFIDNWKTPKWRTYWIYLLLRNLVRITGNIENIIYDFHGKFERGQEKINKSDAVSSSLYMTTPFNSFLTHEYVKKFENPQAMKYTKILCDDLKSVFKRILIRNKWLQPSTKKYALKKLDYFKFIYGKPENIMEDPKLNYGTELYDNMKMLYDWRHDQFIKLEGKHIVDFPMVDWGNYPVKMTGTQAYIVNASYTPSQNSIYINLGYIQKPFIDLDERGIEYNLAHLGYTICHEMSHGFDDMGSKYGYDGKLYDWWTNSDKQKYKKIQDDVIKQYEVFALRDGIKFDASMSIGEDLADISGMAICDEYLRDFQDNNNDLIPIRALSYEGFYTYFAFQQKQFIRKKSISAQLKTNPHPLDKYRCNIPLSRSEIFRSIYNVKKGDDMWWHNTNTIW